jgi:holliday junction DNA helicase RuvB
MKYLEKTGLGNQGSVIDLSDLPPLTLPERSIMEVVSPSNSPPRTRNIFMPTSFEEYVGQETIKKLVNIRIKAAKMQGRPLPHFLITGEFGLGKTTFAKLIGKEYSGKNIIPHDANKMDLFNIPTSGVVIIDEIHNLADAVMDSLNIVMDTYPNLTLIGATTDSGKLTAPFRSRFQILNLQPYSVEDLIKIVTIDYQKRGGIKLSPEQVVQIALRSRMNARQATHNLSLIFDLMAVYEESELTDSTLTESFDLAGLDKYGLRPIDRLYLRALNQQGTPVGIQYISARTGADPATILEEIEPFLLRTGMIERQIRGRVITGNGVRVLSEEGVTNAT